MVRDNRPPVTLVTGIYKSRRTPNAWLLELADAAVIAQRETSRVRPFGPQDTRPNTRSLNGGSPHSRRKVRGALMRTIACNKIVDDRTVVDNEGFGKQARAPG